MENELSKIDAIRERTGVSYKAAKQALEESNGDVLEALIALEERGKSWTEQIQVRGEELLSRIKSIIREGNVSRIRVRRGNKVLLEIPVTLGVVGALLLPWAAALSVVAAVVSQCTIEVDRMSE